LREEAIGAAAEEDAEVEDDEPSARDGAYDIDRWCMLLTVTPTRADFDDLGEGADASEAEEEEGRVEEMVRDGRGLVEDAGRAVNEPGFVLAAAVEAEEVVDLRDAAVVVEDVDVVVDGFVVRADVGRLEARDVVVVGAADFLDAAEEGRAVVSGVAAIVILLRCVRVAAPIFESVAVEVDDDVVLGVADAAEEEEGFVDAAEVGREGTDETDRVCPAVVVVVDGFLDVAIFDPLALVVLDDAADDEEMVTLFFAPVLLLLATLVALSFDAGAVAVVEDFLPEPPAATSLSVAEEGDVGLDEDLDPAPDAAPDPSLALDNARGTFG